MVTYGLETDGHSISGGLRYDTVKHTFHTGETIHNFNGISYQILDVLSPENLLLRSAKSGEILIGCNTKYYKRMPQKEFSSNE